MTVTIRPSTANGTVQAPPSKSMAHRLLVCAGLAVGKSVLTGIAPSQDMLATMDCLKALGAEISLAEQTATVQGVGKRFPQKAVLPCRECGSTLRFFLPLALLCGGKITLTGSETLLARPMQVYEDICSSQGLLFQRDKMALTVGGLLSAGAYSVPGNISSQFISGLCFALPLLQQDSSICIIPPIESSPYIDMTLQALSSFGITIHRTQPQTIRIPGRQSYHAADMTVEGDYSNAAFLDALNLLGGHVHVKGLSAQSLQGDRVYRKLFDDLRDGCPTVDLADCPDLGPVCMAMAAVCNGATFIGTRRLRIKESDRCAAMAQELQKVGIKTRVQQDSMTVYAETLQTPTVPIDSHNDHRIVMAMALLLTKTGGRIVGAEAVRKSYPNFFETLSDLGIEVEREDGMDS